MNEPHKTRDRRVCFFRRLAYGAFDSRAPLAIGGAEVRSRHFAVGLAARPGYQVSYLVGDQGQTAEQVFDGVRVIREPQSWDTFFDRAYARFRKYARRTGNFPYLEIEKAHPSLLWTIPVMAYYERVYRKLFPLFRMDAPRPQRFLRRLGLDVFCCFGAAAGAADMIASCRAYGIRSVQFLIHDWETDPAILNVSPFVAPLYEFRERIRFAVENANCVVAQTRRQQAMVKEVYGREAVLIRNPIDLEASPSPLPAAQREFVFWVGRAEPEFINHKRPELCLELARRLPEVPFLAVINPVDSRVFNQLVASAPPNLKILESVPRDQIESYFRRAAVFINTSSQEGFPNTFLQAAKYSVPIVSLDVDPDGFLSEHGSGTFCGGDLQKMCDAIHNLWSHRERIDEVGAIARRYVEQEYDLKGRINQLEALIENLFERPPDKSVQPAPN